VSGHGTPGSRAGRSQVRAQLARNVGVRVSGKPVLQFLRGVALVSRLSATIPHPTSSRTTAPCLATTPSRADAVRSRAAEGLVKWCGWHGMQGCQDLVSRRGAVRHVPTVTTDIERCPRRALHAGEAQHRCQREPAPDGGVPLWRPRPGRMAAQKELANPRKVSEHSNRLKSVCQGRACNRTVTGEALPADRGGGPADHWSQSSSSR
jgi:hypothetical protein